MKKIVGDKRVILKCCTLYYEEKLSQQQIGKVLGISRPTVSRLLKEAKEQGIVQIKIHDSFKSDYHELERILEKKFALREVIIVDDSPDVTSEKNKLGKGAAEYLERILRKGDVVGVSMGTTIKEIAKFVGGNNYEDSTFLPLIGGVGQIGKDIHPNQIVIDLANAFRGKVKLLHAPAVLSDVSIKENLQKDKGIKEVIEEMERTNIAIVGIGVPTNRESTMMATGYFDEEDMEVLNNNKAAGDICLQFYDINGKDTQFKFNEKIFGIELSKLKDIPVVIGVAGGNEKVKAILGAINGKFINVLITSYSCGKKLLQF